MIEYAICGLIGTLALGVLIVSAPLAELLRAVARHRDAQATSVLHHCGQLDDEASE